MNKFAKRQLRVTVLLVLAIAVVLAAALYVRWEKSFDEVELPLSATQDDLAQALIRYKRLPAGEEAALATLSSNETARVELALTGLPGESDAAAMAPMLEESGVPVTCYITLSEAANDQASIEWLLTGGVKVGVLGNGTASLMDETDPETLTEQLCRASVLLRSRYGVSCGSALTAATPEADALRAAAAVDITRVCVPGATIDLEDCTSVEAAVALLQDVPRGSILRVRVGRGGGQATLMSNLLQAVSATDPMTDARRLLDAAPVDAAAVPMQRVYTTERAVCLTFAGMGNPEELQHLLAVLAELDAKAVFFVDHQEAALHEEEIRGILAQGHELGVKPANDLLQDPVQVLCEIRLAEQELRQRFGYEGEILVRSGLGKPGKVLLRAAEAGGYRVVSNLLSPVQDGDLRVTDPMKVLEGVLPESGRSLQRGEIVHFRMGVYRNNDHLLGDLVRAVLTRRSLYPARTLQAVEGNEEACYTWPLADDQLLPAVRDAVGEGRLQGDVMDVLPARYIGAPHVSLPTMLHGFTDQEIAQLDAAGLVPGAGNAVFLTFDDWGSDKTITPLLDVLEKHGVRATFFIYTENVESNPNLLRAIAEAGHDIGSHMHGHETLATRVGSGSVYETPDEAALSAIRESLVTSHRTMQRIIGDVAVDGRPALTTFFRPPQLLLSRAGAQAVFDAGYTWIVSGSCSTDDYRATDVASLTQTIVDGIQPGAVLIMHISDTSVHTAAAVDAALTQLKESGADYRFIPLSRALEAD